MTSDIDRTEVLIVGAGPVGLCAAIDLARRGTAIRVVDTLPEPTVESRAIVVHSRTLDHFEALGVLDGILERAIKSTGMEIHSEGRTLAAVEFDHILAAHPFSVSLVQSDTEQVLAARLAELGVPVERSSTLTGYAVGADGVEATMADASGATHVVSARFLIGADGARSTVRHLMGQELAGSFVCEDVLLGDVEGVHDYERSHFHAFLSPGETTGLLFPLRGDRVRIFAELPECTDPDRPVTIEWMQQVVDERGIALKITASHWLTRFELKHGQAQRYRAGRVFLAGDAAHIHSPAGALGMNTGIQDAINLSWKLATALRADGGERLLDSYHLERHPIGAQVVSFTTMITKVATLKNPVAQRLRNTLMHVGIHVEPLANRMADTVELQRVQYRHSRIVNGSGRHLHPGDFLHLGDTRIAAKLAVARDHIAIVVPGQGRPSPQPGPRINEINVSDRDIETLTAATGLAGGGIVIVRPDGYVGHIGTDPRQGPTEYLDLLNGRDVAE